MKAQTPKKCPMYAERISGHWQGIIIVDLVQNGAIIINKVEPDK
jgi:RNA polymerase subunit RPABC4/transcription elongation factor Spt4